MRFQQKILLLCGVLLSALPSGVGAPPSAPGARDGWVLHTDPAGFSLSHPRGWRVETTPERILVRSADRRSLVAIQPLMLPEATRAGEWLRRLPARCGRLFPQAKVGPVQSRGQAAVAEFVYRWEGEPVRASALCSLDGRAGMLYAIAAPDEAFTKQRAVLVRVLRTLSFRAPSAAARKPAAKPDAEYVAWTDPRERAFSVRVPKGWAVRGGLARHAAVDTRVDLAATSPDGKVRIGIGDSRLPSFILPTPALAAMGFVEGSVYSPGYGLQMVVRRYAPGAAFAKQYIQAVVGADCTDLRFTPARDLPTVARVFNDLSARYGNSLIGVRHDAGLISFTCRRQGQPQRGMYLALTQATAMPAGGIWRMVFLYGYLAPESRAGQAEEALSRMVKSFTPNPEWERMQTGIAAGTSRIVTGTNEAISTLLREARAHRERSGDEAMRHWSNATLGVTDVEDPETGERWKVAAGHNYYWRRAGADTVAGTRAADRPDIDFTPLLER